MNRPTEFKEFSIMSIGEIISLTGSTAEKSLLCNL